VAFSEIFLVRVTLQLPSLSIFVWKIVLGITFLSSVYNGLTMPEFSATHCWGQWGI